MDLKSKIPVLTVYDENGNRIPIPAIAGKSAYAYAKEGGYTGTEEEFAQKMADESAVPPLRLFASGFEAGTTVNPIKITNKNPSTNAAYTAEEISEMAMTRPVVMNTTRATMYGNIDGTFRYYRAVQTNGELAYVEFTGYYADLDGKWIPATAKIGADNIVVIEDETWAGGGVSFIPDETLKFENDTLSVNTIDTVKEGSKLPITSGAVFTTVGNIEVLMKTI